MAVVLVGMPGCGKSTVGRQLAKVLGLRFMDADVEVERKLGHTIREHFDRFGESAFRDVEQAALEELCCLDGVVLATGGGAVLRDANRAAIARIGNQVVYLRAQVDDLVRRLKHDAQRPLLQGVDPSVRLRELFSKRDPLYREVAHHVVDTGRLPVVALANLLAMQLNMASLGDGSPGRSAD